ncbi:MAG: hypothetical protein H6865_08250 [Rhodospirillales bacterium]|nr:hypothetical protein [Alphaproteobacteria bacterium]MCB9987607.1 hypothetical protein [Rhodospirillales bacterium]USO07678.1 MAG: hypothetical protein H6866_00100 [Rhodospirillales bacterium]
MKRFIAGFVLCVALCAPIYPALAADAGDLIVCPPVTYVKPAPNDTFSAKYGTSLYGDSGVFHSPIPAKQYPMSRVRGWAHPPCPFNGRGVPCRSLTAASRALTSQSSGDAYHLRN